MPTPNQGPRPITDTDLTPLTPRQEFLAEANRIQVARLQTLAGNVSRDMSAANFAAIKRIAGHANPALDEHEKKSRIETDATARSQALTIAQTSIYGDVVAALNRRGIPLDPNIQADAARIEANLQARLAENIKLVVPETMLEVYNRVIKADLRAEQLERDRLARDATAAAQAQAANAHTPPLASRLRPPAATTTTPAQAEQRLSPEEQEDFDREQVKNAERVEYFARALNKDKIDLNEWIANSGLKDPSTRIDGQSALFEAELEKLRQLGIWKAHTDPNDTDPCASAARSYINPLYFKFRQACMWTMTAATVSLTLCASAAGPGALMMAGPVLGLANIGAQEFIKFYYDRKFKQIFQEMTREITDAGPMESGIAWAGVMIKFLQDYRPYMIRSVRADVTDDHMSMEIDAAINQLKQAALHGARSIQSKDREIAKETFFKDTKFNDYIKQNEAFMKALEKRWLGASDWAAKAGWAGGLGGIGWTINSLM